MSTYFRDAKLVVVTATTNAERFQRFDDTLANCHADVPTVVVAQAEAGHLAIQSGMVVNVPDYMGVVPAFALGVEAALQAYPNAEVIACLHDDCLVQEPDWDRKLLEHFQRNPQCGLAGFGGAWGAGDPQAGQGEYRPDWLVRRGFMSNMQDAEVHGTRVTEARRVACLDGFSLVFRRQFLACTRFDGRRSLYGPLTLFDQLQEWGVVHHAYDLAMGIFARDLGWDTWLLPFACRHLGGQTAVGDAGYAEWARKQRVPIVYRTMPAGVFGVGEPLPLDTPRVMVPGGDQAFWTEAHRIVWAKLGHRLPFEVDQP